MPWSDDEIAILRQMLDAGKPTYLIAAKLKRTRRAVQNMGIIVKAGQPDA